MANNPSIKKIAIKKQGVKKVTITKPIPVKILKKLVLPFIYKCDSCSEEEKHQKFQITLTIEKVPNTIR